MAETFHLYLLVTGPTAKQPASIAENGKADEVDERTTAQAELIDSFNLRSRTMNTATVMMPSGHALNVSGGRYLN